MIKNMLYICLLTLLTFSCEQKESFYYESQDGLYFTLPGTNLRPWTTEAPEEFSREIEFAFRKTGEWSPNSYELYYGDSLRADTLRFIIAVAGTVTDYPREYNLKAIPIVDTLETNEIQFSNPYRLEAGATMDTAIVVIPRSYKRGEFAVGITFDLENSAHFDSAITGWDIYDLYISDRYPEPRGWNVAKYGEYSEEKYAFWVTVMQTTYENEYMAGFDEYWMPIDIVSVLNTALKEYNTAHPEARKEFTFPGYVE